ncbi:MAG: hypothetical protein H6567_05220 [Lewinellaceae bacterium]|nr:hypothetical protein [Lewinellaceae bacterium]
MSKYFIISFSLILWFSSCTKDAIITSDCTGVTPTYTDDIKAIMDASCAYSGCHSAASKRDGIDLSTYAKVKSESQKNRFLGSIQHLSGYKRMPENASKLSDDTIQKIYCWIENGNPE